MVLATLANDSLRSTKEMVIMDFHRFPNGFDDSNESNHAALLRLLQVTHHLKIFYYMKKMRELS